MTVDVKTLIAEGHKRAEQWRGYNPHTTILKFIAALESAEARAETAEAHAERAEAALRKIAERKDDSLTGEHRLAQAYAYQPPPTTCQVCVDNWPCRSEVARAALAEEASR